MPHYIAGRVVRWHAIVNTRYAVADIIEEYGRGIWHYWWVNTRRDEELARRRRCYWATMLRWHNIALGAIYRIHNITIYYHYISIAGYRAIWRHYTFADGLSLQARATGYYDVDIIG